MTRPLVGLLAAALVLLTSGCEIGTDDEMAPPPTRTITASPSASAAPAPATIPVGHAAVSPSDAVWAQGSVLHVGRRVVDLATVDIESFVVVPGGVFLLSGGELWFTDLTRLRATGQTEVVGVRVSPDASRLVVADTRGGEELEQAYDTASGRAVSETVPTASPDDRLGSSVDVDLRGDRADVVPAGSGTLTARRGPGRFGVAFTAAGAPVPFDAEAGKRVRATGLPRVFELAGWSGPSGFYGVAGRPGSARRVVSCDLEARRCVRLGPVEGANPLLFGTGT